MKSNRNHGRNGGALMWIMIVLAIAVGAYLAFGVMGLHRIRGKIDEALGKKPVTAPRGDEGALMIHQENLRQESELREKVVNEAMEAQGKIDAQSKSIRREFMKAERGE
jgi:hypothetical protein